MPKNSRSLVLYAIAIFAAGIWVGSVMQSRSVVHAQANSRVFEIRTYTAEPGKLDALNARFRNHTLRIFERHGMKNIGYWTPQDPPLSQNTLIYILSHANREAAKKSWEGFRNDPEWQKARTESEAQGRIVSKVESVFADATDYSPMK